VAWYNLGNVLAKLERYPESDHALDLALAIDERFSSAWFSKARNLLLASRFEEAIGCYEETLAFDGPQAITFSFIGECHEKMERYDLALVNYDQAIGLDPEWVDAWIGRGVVMDLQDRVNEAVVALRQAVIVSPEHPDALYYYASALARAKDHGKALEVFAKLNGVEPQSLDGWLDHAELLHGLKGPEAAAAKLQEGAQVHRLNVTLQICLPLGELPAADADGMQQALLLNWKRPSRTDHAAHTQLLEHLAAGRGNAAGRTLAAALSPIMNLHPLAYCRHAVSSRGTMA
jgi:tetratricopeptide (TPR) repeat protein